MDAFLAQAFPEYSRSYLHRLVKSGNVSVNESFKLKPSLKLEYKDVVNVAFAPADPIDLTPKFVDFDVIDEQEDFLVINKPAGLLVHPAASASGQITLVHGLLERFPEFREFTGCRPGIVHRLDRDTSGLLVVARNEHAHARLSELFSERKVTKEYMALVKGHPDKEGRIDEPLGRHPTNKIQIACRGINARTALTFYEVEEYFDNADASLVKVRIVTGRTHQIRVHMLHIGHPVLGDVVYNQTKHPLFRRQALHAAKMSFSYQGKEFSYEAPIPGEMTSGIIKLRIF